MSLRLTRLTLSRFRSHPRTEVAFDGRPVVLFGANGAGKTNLLEAVSLLSPGRGLRRAAGEELGARPAGLGWKIDGEIGRSGVAHEIETGATPGQPRSVRIDGKAAPQSALGRLMPMLWLTPAMDRLWIEAAEGRRRFLDRLVLGFVPDHAEVALAYEKAMRQRNRLLRDGVTDPRWYAALEARMAEAGGAMSANRRAALARLAGAVDPDSPFPQPDLTLADDSPEDLASALAEGRRRDMAAGRSLVGPHRADLSALWAARGWPAAQCSTGEQKALLISTVLAHARALHAEVGHAPILLLDEVAAHLDDGRRAALYDALSALGAQAFLTGTGPELFSPLGTRAQVFRVAEEAGDSRLQEEDLA
ncbi:DNA replication/repair protein RecF [Rhodobacter sp. NTK016B]|uniref:DNA replication/repair protein RecF n=1 Tax=Rhodobacter sp. NTK016B TaxID=2759676 RepID=UPI001A90B8D6|nr:DNA replication/repair protein RecF [Rhodobacter sp. NTK016B]MBN8292313.1 DNA replication/repair protein RecF [Rhodobacter sp. NTK016B]